MTKDQPSVSSRKLRFSLLNLILAVSIAAIMLALIVAWRERNALKVKVETQQEELKEQAELKERYLKIARQMFRLKAELGNLQVEDRGRAHRERVGTVTGNTYTRKHLRFRVFLPALPDDGKYAHCIAVGTLPKKGLPGWQMKWPTEESPESNVLVSVAEVEADREYIFDIWIRQTTAFLSDIWGEQLASIPIKVGKLDVSYENLDDTYGWDEFYQGINSTGTARLYERGLPIGLVHWRAIEGNTGRLDSTPNGTDHVMSWIAPWDDKTHGQAKTRHKFVPPVSATK